MGYYGEFPRPIPHLGVRSIALLTLSPLALAGTFDVHVLAMPPAFNLSHDQTLQLMIHFTVLRRLVFHLRLDHVKPRSPDPGVTRDPALRGRSNDSSSGLPGEGRPSDPPPSVAKPMD